jgi:hypothetical protein
VTWYGSEEESVIEKFKPYIDSFGLLAQTDGDGGDSAQREGMLLTAAAALLKLGKISLNDYIEVRWRFLGSVQNKIIRSDGKLRRHCDETKWYGQWNRGSRDQAHIIIGMGLANCMEPLERMRLDHQRRLYLFTTNTVANTSDHQKWKLPDLTGPGFWAMWIRAFNRTHPSQGTLKSILFFMDLSLVANSLIWRFYHLKYNKEHTDILNHLQAMIQSKMSLDTPLAKLARWILKSAPIKEMLKDYFAPSTNGITPLAEVYEPIVDWVQS